LRIEAVEPGLALLAANQASYLELNGLQGKVSRSALRSNSGVRYLYENRWGGVDFSRLLKCLNISANKFMILRLLKHSDLVQLLSLMDRADLINGMRLFDREKLLRFLMQLPKEFHIKMLLTLWGLNTLMEKLPTRELFNILKSKRLPVSTLANGFASMPRVFLDFIMGKIMDRNLQQLGHSEMIAIFKQLKKRTILDGMRFLPYKALVPFVTNFAANDPAVLLQISQAFLFKTFEKMSKPAMLEGFALLDSAVLIQFLSLLPDQFLAQVVCQVDDSVFEKYLLSEQSALLANLANQVAA